MKRHVFTTLILTLSLALFSLAALAGTPAKSIDNIKAAIKGETTASAKYAAYAKKAEEEGHARIALLFRAASRAEGIHANNHSSVLKQMNVTMDDFTPEFTVKSTAENLQDAINGESYEVATMYPQFIKQALSDQATLASISFNYAYQTEKKHKAMYENALNKLKAGREGELSDLYMVCTTCGNTYDGEAPARCGISMTPRERFLRLTL